ncbi:uncharacterized mitochondrial protein AtMg00810-like [Phaseolus vulgaris]|uniref:uncharacterized mitochondrial protein AtMg00810-like n=1 Tax=Phaseolus vulgaris TaxID=3885 RepID=UPI0035CAC1D5
MISSLRFIVDDSVSIAYPTLYRSIVRALEYVTLTRFELSFSVNKSSPNYSIVVFSDSDWATDLDDRKSTTGYCIFVGRNLVS